MPIQRPTTIQLRSALFRDAVSIVEEEYGSDLSLDDIARRIASSRRQLQRAYAEVGDTTFRDHLTAIRMQRASELLATRPLTVREVAGRVGYRQPAQFAKAFRRHIGHSPSAFRSDERALAVARESAAARQSARLLREHGNGHNGDNGHNGSNRFAHAGMAFASDRLSNGSSYATSSTVVAERAPGGRFARSAAS